MHVVEVLTDRLKVLMKEHGVKAAPLARRAQLNESAVRDILRGRSKNPGIVTLTKIAGVLNLRPSALYEEDQSWPVLGAIEGDGQLRDLDDSDGQAGRVLNPFFAMRVERYGAVLVQGSGLAPLAFDGDYLIVERDAAGVQDIDLGRPCLCTLEDGRRVVRAIRRGDEPNRFHLFSVGPYGASEPNAAVQSAVRIALVLPPAFVPDLPEPTHKSDLSVMHEEGAAYSAT